MLVDVLSGLFVLAFILAVVVGGGAIIWSMWPPDRGE